MLIWRIFVPDKKKREVPELILRRSWMDWMRYVWMLI